MPDNQTRVLGPISIDALIARLQLERAGILANGGTVNPVTTANIWCYDVTLPASVEAMLDERANGEMLSAAWSVFVVSTGP